MEQSESPHMSAPDHSANIAVATPPLGASDLTTPSLPVASDAQPPAADATVAQPFPDDAQPAVDPVNVTEATEEVAQPAADPVNATEATASPSAPSDPSVLVSPIEHTAPGISSVADFLPSNTEPAQPLETTAQEPEPAPAHEDAVMTDVASTEPEKPAEEPFLPVDPVASEPVQQHTPAPESLQADVPLESAQASQKPSPAPVEAALPEVATLPEQPNGDASVATPVSTQPTTDLAPTTLPEVTAPIPQSTDNVSDTIVLGTTRPREDDDDGNDEPNAKRSKVEESVVAPSVETPVTDDFKRPEIPAAAPVATPVAAPATAPPATNGNATGHLPPRSQYSSAPLTQLQRKILEEKIKNTKKVKSAIPFLRPVDYVALNIPNYPNVIKQPMDISTMEQKLKANQYTTLEEFVNDFELMVNNCFTFNGPVHAVSAMAQNLRAYFLKQMDSVPTGDAATAAKPLKKDSPAPRPQPPRESRASIGGATAKPPAPTGETFALLPGGTPQIRRDSTAGRPKRAIVPPAPRDLPYSGSKPKRKENMAGLKFCDYVLEELRKPRYAAMNLYFLHPVDPVALNIPHYRQIIKRPMDMQTITNKYKNSQYSSADEFKADFELMFDNCYKFNPPDNGVHIAGKQLQAEFNSLWKQKAEWIKKNAPRSQRVTPASDDESDSDESSDEDVEDGEDEKEETIRQLKEQLAAMQNMLGSISSGTKRDSPKAGGKKKARTSSGVAKTKKSKDKPARPKAKKQRLITYDEKQEISNAAENMTEAQIGRLTEIITQNVSQYRDMGDDVELEIDDLPNEVQHKLLKYVRTIFPATREEVDEFAAIDDDYEPSARQKAAASAGGGRKKHKPMKKAEQERRIAELQNSINRVEGNVVSSSAVVPTVESSDDEDSESSEEE